MRAMWTFQVRPRVFRHDADQPFAFPADCEIRFHLRPLQAFGVEPGNGRMVVHNSNVQMLFNANTGEITFESDRPLRSLEVEISGPPQTVRLRGASLTLTQRLETLRELEDVVLTIYFGMPAVLNIPFADPPYVERVEGVVGTSAFRWELASWTVGTRPITQELQEAAAAEAWARLQLVAAPHRRRLVAALHYFHVACRLSRRGDTAVEFLAE